MKLERYELEIQRGNSEYWVAIRVGPQVCGAGNSVFLFRAIKKAWRDLYREHPDCQQIADQTRTHGAAGAVPPDVEESWARTFKGMWVVAHGSTVLGASTSARRAWRHGKHEARERNIPKNELRQYYF